jgi:hypothetical protein
LHATGEAATRLLEIIRQPPYDLLPFLGGEDISLPEGTGLADVAKCEAFFTPWVKVWAPRRIVRYLLSLVPEATYHWCPWEGKIPAGWLTIPNYDSQVPQSFLDWVAETGGVFDEPSGGAVWLKWPNMRQVHVQFEKGDFPEDLIISGNGRRWYLERYANGLEILNIREV